MEICFFKALEPFGGIVAYTNIHNYILRTDL